MPEEPRQRVERAGGKARRARLTPAPGSDPAPEQPVDGPEPEKDRITRERPPHW